MKPPLSSNNAPTVLVRYSIEFDRYGAVSSSFVLLSWMTDKHHCYCKQQQWFALSWAINRLTAISMLSHSRHNAGDRSAKVGREIITDSAVNCFGRTAVAVLFRHCHYIPWIEEMLGW